ncbi:hypothetical protein BJ508DRAFT_307518 [Ascobolus immersus RN42]|uniref:Uncharacterized protein n=1 Tax=Ascobolus immersus RN42 TaxID=1160509 RepID=A0A3N4I2H4_ASCIM|nr:hypothetical protein BJ508DRAFT_307518 [Ascobolus immersus RN42]
MAKKSKKGVGRPGNDDSVTWDVSRINPSDTSLPAVNGISTKTSPLTKRRVLLCLGILCVIGLALSFMGVKRTGTTQKVSLQIHKIQNQEIGGRKFEKREPMHDYWTQLHALTAANKLRELGHKGAGCTVAFLDQQFRLDHAAFASGDSSTEKTRIVSKWNVVDDNDIVNPDNVDYAHGSQCLSVTFGASALLAGLSPDINILAVSVRKAGGRRHDDPDAALSKGIVYTFENGADVLSNWHDGDLQRKINEYVGRGMLVVTSSSNYGGLGANTLGSSGAASLAITVGNYAPSISPVHKVVVEGEYGLKSFSTLVGVLSEKDLPLDFRILSDIAGTEDLCSPTFTLQLQLYRNRRPRPTRPCLLGGQELRRRHVGIL